MRVSMTNAGRRQTFPAFTGLHPNLSGDRIAITNASCLTAYR